MKKNLLTLFVLVVSAMSAWAQNVAQIDGTSYESLAEAVSAAQDDETIIVLEDVALSKTLEVAGKDITLDLNGKTISGTCNAGSASLVHVANTASLTIVDNGTNGTNGKLTYAPGSSTTGWTVHLEGALTLNSGALELTGDNWDFGYVVDVRPNAWGTAYTNPTVLTMNDGQLISSKNAVRVSSSSYASYKAVSASFVMYGGSVDAVGDGVFIQQQDGTYDVLNFTINDGTITGDRNPVRVYGPAATGYVNGEECMTLNFNGGTMPYNGTVMDGWIIEGILRVGGGSSVETITESGSIVATEKFVQANEVSLPAKVGETYYLTLDDAATDGEDKEIEVELSGEHTLADDVSYEHTNTVTVTVSGSGKLTYTRGLIENWNPLYLPFEAEVNANEYKVAGFYSADGDGITLQLIAPEDGKITLTANTPYVIRYTNEEYKDLTINLNGKVLEVAEEKEAEWMDATTYDNGFVIKGNYKMVTGAELTANDWVVSTAGKWGKLKQASTLRPYRLILTTPEGFNASANAKSFSMRVLDGTTVVEEIELDLQHEECIFDLSGRRVDTMTEGGIYIVNGKKVIF